MTTVDPAPFWANLLHLGTNMWGDVPGTAPNSYCDTLRCDDDMWLRVTARMAEVGCTMVVIDVADGIEYASHPDLAVKQAWSQPRLAEELDRLRELGLEPIPKLNFSATHDAWLGDWSRRIATEPYYALCRDLIAEVASLFDQPRFFHLGMDEEDAQSQAGAQLAVTRQHDLWWHDLSVLTDAATQAGARPWVWSDYAWSHPDEFYRRMPRDVLQSNWFYRNAFSGADETRRPARLTRPMDRYVSYLDLDDHGYDQVPTGSNWLYRDNLARTCEFIRERVTSERVLGFLQTSWRALLPEYEYQHGEAIDGIADAMARWGATDSLDPDQGE